MKTRHGFVPIFVAIAAFAVAPPLFAAKFLFDATKAQMCTNADWILDADVHNVCTQSGAMVPGCGTESNPQRIPTPAASGITSSTAEDYWQGAVSAWGVELVKLGHTVETLPIGGQITFGNGSNVQDLSNYDVFISIEPNIDFTAAERTAILSFVNAGGGLFMIADHPGSDRNSDGVDSPVIWNNLDSKTYFGIEFATTGSYYNIVQDPNNNFLNVSGDPITKPGTSDAATALGFHNGTTLNLYPANNASVAGKCWMNGVSQSSTTQVTFATATYGAGRVAALGDSSPADDGTGDPGDSLYVGWASTTATNDRWHMNASIWLAGGGGGGDTTAPVISAGPSASPLDCSATITWTTDEPATSVVDYGTSASYGSTSSGSGYAASHSVTITGLASATLYHYRVSSTDASNNGPTQSTDHTFTTASGSAPIITSGPTVSAITGSTATVSWVTNEASNSRVDYGLTGSYGSNSTNASYVTSHSVTLTGLTATTTYHYRVQSTDGCGNGPTSSTDATFTTGSASLDLSGWTLYQYNSTQSYTFPAGTTIASNGYLVVGRNVAQSAFEAEWGTLPAGVAYVNSGEKCPMINGGESYELKNASGTTVDGPTITMSTSTGTSIARKNPGDAAGSVASWNSVSMASSTPGDGAGNGTGVGVVINEASDSPTSPSEFVELYYDATSAPSVTATPTATPSTKCSGATTQLDAGAAGGTPPYTYVWSPATGLSSTTIANPTCSVASTTTYQVTVNDSASHVSSPASVTVTIANPAGTPTATPSTICSGSSSQLHGVGSGGTAPYTYQWSPATGLSSTTVENPTANPTSTTIYNVVVTDSLGCSSSSIPVTVTVTSPSTPVPPTGVRATAGNGQVVVAWDSTGAAQYRVYRGAGNCSFTLGTPLATVSTTTWTDSSAVNGTSYCYKVTSYAGTCGGESQPGTSTSDSAATPGTLTEVSGGGAPQRFRLVKSTAGKIEIRFEWKDPSSNLFHLYTAPTEAAMNAGTYATKFCNLQSNANGTWALGSGSPPSYISWTLANGTLMPSENILVVAETGGSESPYGYKSDGTARTKDADKTATSNIGCSVSCTSVSASISSITPSASVALGTQQTFTGTGGGQGTLTYQWDFSYDGVTFNVEGSGTPINYTYGSAGSYTVALRVTDSCTNPSAQSAIATQAVTITSGTSRVVISRVYGGGGSASGYYIDDFIELFNAGTASQDVSTWSVQYGSATGTTWSGKTNLTGSIAPGKYLLVRESHGTAGAAIPTPDVTGTIAMANDKGKVALVSNQTTLTGTCPTANVVDMVGYGGTANCYETAPTTLTATTTEADRKNAGCTDTGDNSADFTITGCDSTNNLPHNSASAYHGCP
jgi:hypothetical protein